MTVTACPDGPLLVLGPAVIPDRHGVPVERHRASAASCRRGGTAVAPWCDSTH